MLDVEQRPPGGLDGERDRARDQTRVREVVARVVKEAVDRTDRSPRKVGELLLELGYAGKRNGEPYSDGAVRNWMNRIDRPLAEVIVALALHHDLSLDDYLYGTDLRGRVGELEELVARIAAHTGYHLDERKEATGS